MYVTKKQNSGVPTQATNAIHVQYDQYDSCDCFITKSQEKNISFHTSFKLDQGATPLTPWFCPSLPTTIASSGRSVWETPLAKCLVGRKQDTNLSGFKSYTETKEIYRYNIFDACNNKFIFQRLSFFVSPPGFHCGQKKQMKCWVNPFE